VSWRSLKKQGRKWRFTRVGTDARSPSDKGDASSAREEVDEVSRKGAMGSKSKVKALTYVTGKGKLSRALRSVRTIIVST